MIDDVRDDGFDVHEDLTVTDTRTSATPAEQTSRQALAEEHADFIAYHAGPLLALDREYAAKVDAATAGLIDQALIDAVTFTSDETAPGVQLAGFGETPPLGVGAGDMSSGDLPAIENTNHELLDNMLEEYRQLPDGQVKTDRLADIARIREALKTPDSHLVHVARPDDPSQMIPAAIAIGDPFKADHVSVTVPGVGGTTRQSIATMTQEASDLRKEAVRIADKVGESDNVSAIAWMGYQPPLVVDSWDTVNDGLAQAGAPKLTAFLHDLDAGSHNPDRTTALFGHSYGSLVSGIALQDGASSVVDNAVLYGSPGFGASSTAQLGMNDHNFFVMTTPDDYLARGAGLVAPLHGWGSDPNDIIGGVPNVISGVPVLPEEPARYRFPQLDTGAGSVNLGVRRSTRPALVGIRNTAKNPSGG